MNRQGQVKELLGRCLADLVAVEGQYRTALKEQMIAASLRIDVKNLCENLRSALDYSAADIRDTVCGGVATKPYFPIVDDACSFRERCTRWFPGLEAANAALWRYLESIQPYHSGCEWLGEFRDVVNEHKHEGLVEQRRIERPEVRVKRGSSGVSWNPNLVRFSGGVSVVGAPIDPTTQMPVPTDGVTVERIVWVDFFFVGTNLSALGLLRQAASGVKAIADETYRLMGSGMPIHDRDAGV